MLLGCWVVVALASPPLPLRIGLMKWKELNVGYPNRQQCDQILEQKSCTTVSKRCRNTIQSSFYINWSFSNDPKSHLSFWATFVGKFVAKNFQNRPIWSHWSWRKQFWEPFEHKFSEITFATKLVFSKRTYFCIFLIY